MLIWIFCCVGNVGWAWALVVVSCPAPLRDVPIKFFVDSEGKAIKLYGTPSCICADVEGIAPILPSTFRWAVMAFISTIMATLSLFFWRSYLFAIWIVILYAFATPFICHGHGHLGFIFSSLISQMLRLLGGGFTYLALIMKSDQGHGPGDGTPSGACVPLVSKCLPNRRRSDRSNWTRYVGLLNMDSSSPLINNREGRGVEAESWAFSSLLRIVFWTFAMAPPNMWSS